MNKLALLCGHDSLVLQKQGDSVMGEARIVRADRSQLRWDMIDLEAMLPSDHRARIVWAFVERLDISVLYDRVKSREGVAGRPPADPRSRRKSRPIRQPPRGGGRRRKSARRGE